MEETEVDLHNKKSVSSVFAQVLFSHVGLFFLVAGYAAFGAWAFVELEKGAENNRYLDKVHYAKAVEDVIEVTTLKFWAYGDEKTYNFTYPQFINKTLKDLKKMERYVLDAVNNHNYDGSVDSWDYDWTFFNCLLLTMSIITTIGYGHIAPKTLEGQLFCIVYALIGCPLFLVFLANIGDAMANGFIYLYSRWFCRTFRSRRYLEEVPEGQSKKSRKQVLNDVVGNEPYMPTSKVLVPITLSIVVLHAFMILGGVLFAYWEEWDLGSSFYFTFVTLSTIGFGDLVPGKALLDTDSLASTLKMLFAITYIVLGMALLSMCINLMQEQIVTKVQWFSKRVGLSKEEDAVQPAQVELGIDDDAFKKPDQMNKRGVSPFRRASKPYDISVRGPEEKLPGSA